ncbi:hypothetical protein LWI28_007971 [Acer negundo]|uniref:Conserved oligomeric Golgi complex subunit 2 n=1 Tax=Acer negundo TaxID=4023 RepID=A0AAD5IQW3_ACENE|nr:hypothetical protein LWI28_007971 [Acer negundo]
MPELILTSPQHKSATDFFSDPVNSHPLWFKSNLFHSPTFDSDSYILDLRTIVPFETLQSELQAHLSSLNHELINLINRDYADFVNLSTKLVDVDTVVVLMRAPLLELREKIEGFRGSVEGSLVASQSALKQRSEAAAAREVLQLLLDTFQVVSKVEKLIKELPSMPTHWSNRDVNLAERNSASYAATLKNVENGTNLRETQSMLLERIASEMNRLKFYFAHAQNLPFIGNMENWFQSASLLLDASLGHFFVDGLEHQDANVICNCLHTYAAINNISNAERKLSHMGRERFLLGHLEMNLKMIIIKSSNVLRKTVNSYWKFLQQGYCPSRSAVAKFRAEPVYVVFMRQWNVGVYFSLRFQEIAGALHSALSLAPIHISHSDEEKSPLLTLKQSATLLESLRSCWREDVFVLTCSDKFLRLSLQLLSRFFMIKNSLASEVCGDYLAHVLHLLSSCPAEVLDPVKQSIIQGGMALKALQPSVINTIVEGLVEKAVEDLRRKLKVMTATFRVPSEPLPAATFRQLKAKETESSRMSAQKRGTASMNVTYHNVSENDKFIMQLFLDIQEYGQNLAALVVEAADIPAYCSLWRCVAPLDRQSVIKFLE